MSAPLQPPSTPHGSTPSPSGGPAQGGLFNLAKLKEGFKKYGKTGLYVYLGISFTVTTCIYLALERNVDVKKLLGMKSDPDKPPSWIETFLVGKGSNIALAIICSKACVPIKIPVALAITPYVHRIKEHVFRGWALRSSRP